jgi:flavin-dependent dehydrogenase
MTSPIPEFRVGSMARLYREMLEAARAAGARWLPRTHFLGLDDEKSHQRLHLKQNGVPLTLKCRLVIGADGARSGVAAALGLHRNRRFLVGAEMIYKNNPGQGLQPGLYCYLDPMLAPGYLAWVTIDFHEKHVGVAGLTGRYSPRSALASFIEKVGPTYGLCPQAIVESRGGLIPVGGIGTQLANSRGLLIGDATGAVSPLTAGGLDPCLRLTEYACRVAKAFLATGAPTVLAAYTGRRFRTRFAKRLLLRKIMDRMTSPLFLELGFSLLALPPFRSMAEEIFFRRGSFPDPGPVPSAQPESPSFGP